MRAGRIARRGTTLLELMFTLAILTVATGALLALSLSIGDTARVQDATITAIDEGHRGLLGIVPRLQQAQRSSINYDELPAEILRFRMPADIDGNGLATDEFNTLELGEEIVIRRDTDDLNQDGRSLTQLLLIEGESIRVLANDLSPETAPTDGATDGDAPVENRAGFWVSESSNALIVTVRTQRTTRRGQLIRREYTRAVIPRN